MLIALFQRNVAPLTVVDNPRHCDFSKLRYMLLNSHLQDLKEITHDILYEQYRTEKLSMQTDGSNGAQMADDAMRAQESVVRQEYAARMQGV
eukprot:jgi/Hompol1/6533/HPOL_000186-RA